LIHFYKRKPLLLEKEPERELSSPKWRAR